MYVHYLYPEYGYIGFDYNPPGETYLLFAWVLSVLPSLWMPIRLTRPSQWAYWVLYITVIIPSMFVPLFAGLDRPTEISGLMLALFVGFAITGASYLLPLFSVRPVEIPRRLVWTVFGGIAVVLSVWMVAIFHNHFQIVSFLDVYDLRDAANDVAEGSQVNYAFMLLSGAINPFLMGYGLYYRRGWLFSAGALGQLLVYSIGGTKGSILSILFVSGLYFLMKAGKLPFGIKVISGPFVLLGAMCLSYVWVGYDPGPIHEIVLFVVLGRLLSINGLLTAQYYDFFQSNPLTYFSHIKVVNLFVHYPYRYPIGQEIGLATAGTTELDATAHFWATDGIGGLGAPGIILISVLCALVFWALDSFARRHDPRLVALVTTYAAYNLANISLFTSLFSGGLAFLIVMLYLMPAEVSPQFPAVARKLKRAIALNSPDGISPSS
jgi:hypothetical protein